MSKKASDYIGKMLHHYRHLADALYPFLSKEMQEHCVFSNIQDQTITYLTTFSGAANIIRFQIPEILMKLHQTKEFKDIKKIQCKVMHAFANRLDLEASAKKVMPTLSLENSQIILEHAQYVTDVALRDSLIRISKHTKNKN